MKKKEIALVIPKFILKSEELKANDKLLFGLHYAYYKKKGITFLTNVEIGKLLCLHPNIISKSNIFLEQKNYIKRTI